MSIAISPEMVALHESLTSPDAEDWNVILDGKTVHIVAMQKDRTPLGRAVVSVSQFAIPLDEFKKTINAYPDHHKGRRRLGVITIVICSDDFERGVYLAQWLTNKARTRNFNVVSIIGKATTAEAVSIQRDFTPPPEFVSIDNLPVRGRAC